MKMRPAVYISLILALGEQSTILTFLLAYMKTPQMLLKSGAFALVIRNYISHANQIHPLVKFVLRIIIIMFTNIFTNTSFETRNVIARKLA